MWLIEICHTFVHGFGDHIHIPIKHDYNYFMLDKFILRQCRNCKIMWLTMTDKGTISLSNGQSINKI